MSYFLCGQTGNNNRGCEAIVRSAVDLLDTENGDIFLATYNYKTDLILAKELGINLLEYKNYKSSVHRAVSILKEKVFPFGLGGQKHIQREVFSRLRTGDTVLNIGGDKYCYNFPKAEVAINRYCVKRGIKTILWCCSIEKEKITKSIERDLERYSYIFAREQMTYENLIEKGISPEKIVKVCDSAFFLNAKKTPLPQNFKEGNTVGINLSGLFVRDDGLGFESVSKLIEYILNERDMSICLIPHVYKAGENLQDIAILNMFYEKFKEYGDRISFVNEDLTCEELKYIISKCRFLVAARTHASIAAYSSGVPTLVLGYSVKAKGIAEDLFGTDENYVIDRAAVSGADDVKKAFIYIVEHENEIRDRLDAFLPEYKKTLSDAVEKYVKQNDMKKPFNICNDTVCSGCLACVSVCPVKAINVKTSGGFIKPDVDFEKCILCGKCKKTCPVLNKPKDDKSYTPAVFGAYNLDEKVRNASSSGGVFTAFAKEILKGGYVVGAAFTGTKKVEHVIVENEEGLAALRGSKYLQSDVNGVYEKTAELLKRGKKVLFSGTPCEIGGLKAYLGKDYENLITVDFICHGVSSPELFAEHIGYLEKKASSKAERVVFREKREDAKNLNLTVGFGNGEKYFSDAEKDDYYLSFVTDFNLRKSCYTCSFKQKKRISDITIADFWGVDKEYGIKDEKKGYSLVMPHTEKGKALFSAVSGNLFVFPAEYSKALRHNPSYVSSAKEPILAEQFMKVAQKSGLKRAVKKYCGNTFRAKLKRLKSKLI